MNLHSVKKLIPVVIAIGTLTVSSCGNRKGGLPQSNQFPVTTVQASSTEMYGSYPAVIKGKQYVEIRPKVSGFITRLCVEEGSAVRAGQTLVTIDNVQYKAAYHQAEAALESAKSALATAELTYKNKKELFNQNIIGEFDLTKAENSLASAKAGLAQAQAAVTSARDNLNYCNVTSPSNGVIGTMPYRVGSLVSASIATPLTTVSNIDQMYVYFSMTEKQLLEMTRERGKNVTSAFPEVQLRLADGSMYEHPGKVSMVSGVIDQSTGTVSVRADFSNPDHLLKSGGTGSIIIPNDMANAIIIPQKCVSEVQNKKFVYTVGKDNKVKYTEIKIKPLDDGNDFIVTDGLKVGDRYVTNGIAKLSDGMEIEPITPEKYQQIINEQAKAMTAGDIVNAMKK
jgi:membrane fusion protein (multidrug efflux system)